jgi:hypothetical protein
MGNETSTSEVPALGRGLLWPFATAAELRARRRQVLPQKAAVKAAGGHLRLGPQRDTSHCNRTYREP